VEVDAWTHFTELLSALVEATHNPDPSERTFEAVLAAFVRLVEADAAARLTEVPEGLPPPRTPLSDPGIRRLLAGLFDLAGCSAGSGADFRELRDWFRSFDAAPHGPR
jgi:hypothetical protein